MFQPERLAELFEGYESTKSAGKRESLVAIEIQRMKFSIQILFMAWVELSFELTGLNFACQAQGLVEMRTQKIDCNHVIEKRSSKVAQIVDLLLIIDDHLSLHVQSVQLNLDVFLTRSLIILGRDLSYLINNCQGHLEKLGTQDIISCPEQGERRSLLTETFEYSTIETEYVNIIACLRVSALIC